MTRLLVRLVLAMLTLPICAAVFVAGMLLAAATAPGGGPPSPVAVWLVWLVVYSVLGAYWTLVWAALVRWTARRVTLTALAALPSLAIAVVFVLIATSLGPAAPPNEIAILLGGGLAPIAWVLATMLIWRETAAERAERLARLGIEALRCPLCAYSMQGLHTSDCPECGARFTIEQLLSAQACRDGPEPTA